MAKIHSQIIIGISRYTCHSINDVNGMANIPLFQELFLLESECEERQSLDEQRHSLDEQSTASSHRSRLVSIACTHLLMNTNIIFQIEYRHYHTGSYTTKVHRAQRQPSKHQSRWSRAKAEDVWRPLLSDSLQRVLEKLRAFSLLWTAAWRCFTAFSNQHWW